MALNFSSFRTITLVSGAALIAATALATSAHATTLKGKLRIYFKGIPVGKTSTTVTVDQGRYSISGSARTNAVVSIIARTKGSFKSSGRFSGRTVVPDSQSSSFQRGKKRSNSTLTFKKSNVVKVTASPAFKYKPGSVPVTAKHLLNVLDPVSALLFPVANGDSTSGTKVCTRTVPVFGGKTRFNLVFTYKSSQQATAKGFKGTVHTCRVQYKPVAGHRPNRKSTKFMVSRKDIEVTFAEIGNSGAFALFGFSLPIRRGIISGVAERFAIQ